MRMPRQAMVMEGLEGLPFDEQMARLMAACSAPARVPALMSEAMGLRDFEPLARLVAMVLARFGPRLPSEVRAALDRVVEGVSELGMMRILRAVDRTRLPEATRAELAELLANALPRRPLADIVATSLMSRWLKGEHPVAWRKLHDAAEAVCHEALAQGDPSHLRDADLLEISGGGLAALDQRFRTRVSTFADEVLATLESQPKSLSQAQAEELLARRVYNDPGHFLIELLQNADDAGATRWSLELSDGMARARHDGAPFDARDVVGVTSIGLTTKTVDQIGFFGVGFKSVYEITDHPRIYSGPFAFEIADVSMPRRLSATPEDLAPGETLLVLPLRDPEDPLRGVAAIHRNARAVPSEALLALSHVRTLRVSREGVGRTVRAETSSHGTRVSLIDEEAGTTTPYAVARGRFAFEGERAPGRPSETDVLVAVRLEEAGRARPLPEGAATMYSFLPTAERSGLKFLVHAHFDVPVDRERLDALSPWNHFALSRAADLLVELVDTLGNEPSVTPESRHALLEVLPLSGDTPEGFRVFHQALSRAADTCAFLPAADGTAIPAGRALRVASDSLREALKGLPLDAAGRRALDALPPRGQVLCGELGVGEFAAGDLARLIARELDGLEDGGEAPAWYVRAVGTLLDALGEGLEPCDLRGLEEVPFLPDDAGGSRVHGGLRRARGALRTLYSGVVPLLESGIDERPTPGQARLFDLLGLSALTPAELAQDLASSPERAATFARTAPRALFEVLSALPDELLRPLRTVALFPDTRGALHALAGVDPAWLRPEGPLGGALEALEVPGPQLLDARFAREHAALLERLGARILDLPALLGALDEGWISVSRRGAVALQRAIAALHEDLTPRLAARLAAAELFPDREGFLRPLRPSAAGVAPALIPADPEIVALDPSAPWIDPSLEALPHLRRLGAAPIDVDQVASAIVRALHPDPPSGGFHLPEGDLGAVRRAYGYLARRPERLSFSARTLLSESPAWMDVSERPRTLAELRWPTSVEPLRAFYSTWSAFSEPADGETAGALRALGLDQRMVTPDEKTFIHDLADPAVPIDIDATEMRGALRVGLDHCARVLRPEALERVREAEIFHAEDGTRLGLGAWNEAASVRAHRVGETLRPLLRLGARPLLAEQDQRDFAALLDALSLREAHLTDLLCVLESEGVLDSSDGPARVRSALVASRAALEKVVDAEARRRLSELPLWPVSDGRCLQASRVARPGELRDVFGDDWRVQGRGAGGLAVLDPDADEDAEALRELFTFRAPGDWIAERVRAEARAGFSLEAQPEWLSDVLRVKALLSLVGKRALELPLALGVDAGGVLRFPPLASCEPDERDLFAGTALFERLADPEWAAAARAVDPDFAPSLSLRRALDALADASRDAAPVASHPLFGDSRRRATLYAWLERHQVEISDDAQARGLLGRARVIPSRKGVLRAPKELLLEPDLPDLGIDWGASGEVPPSLCALLRRWFQPDDERLEPLVRYLLDGHRAAVEASDGRRSNAILEVLARALRDPASMAERVAHFHLPKRLVIQSEEGTWHPPRQLLTVDADARAMLERFYEAPPASPSDVYADPSVRALLEAAGLKTALTTTELSALLRGEGRRAGDESLVALARYAALCALRTPSLREALALDRTAWVPRSAPGRVARPSELYWPSSDAEAVLGPHPDLFPLPEFALTVPDALGTWLKFRHVEDAPLEAVIPQVRDGEAAEAPVLDWLERALERRHVAPEAVRQALGEVRFLPDETGAIRAPKTLLLNGAPELFGRRRGVLEEGAGRYPNLAKALGISASPGAKEVRAFLEEVAGECSTRARTEALLAEEPELIDEVGECLALLAERQGVPPERFPVPAEDASGRVTLLPARDPGLCVARAQIGGGEWPSRCWRAIAPAGDEEAVMALLVRAGIPTLDEWRNPIEVTAKKAEPPEASKPAPETHPKRKPESAGEASRTGEDASLWHRLVKWVGGSEDASPPPTRAKSPPPEPSPEPRPAPEPRSEPEVRPAETPPRAHRQADPRSANAAHRAWFRSEGSVTPQLRDASAWREDRNRVPTFGFAHNPKDVPGPYRYAPSLIASRFERRTQRWLPERFPAEWLSPEGEEVGAVVFQGQVPSGHNLLPVPFFGSVERLEGGGRLLRKSDGRTMVATARDSEVGFRVTLQALPDFEPARVQPLGSHLALLERTAPDEELPEEVLDFAEGLAQSDLPLLERAKRARDFVRDRYRYDGGYLEDPGVAKFLREVTRGSANVHLASLHAGRDRKHLGRGVCYELNVMTCELLRRVEVPAAVCTGWTLDRGQVSEPDHLWALALLPTSAGPRFVPMDAVTTRAGRPLHVAHRPTAPWRAPEASLPRPSVPAWANPAPRAWARESVDGEGRVGRHRADAEDVRRRSEPLRTDELVRVAHQVEALTGERIADEATLRRRCAEILSDPEAAQGLIELIRKGE